jgi:hypothetical protein
MYLVSKRLNRVGMIIVWTACVAAVGQTTSPMSQPASVPTTTQAATRPNLDPAVAQILTRLEERIVNNLRARLAWRQQYVVDLPEDVITKRGQIWYRRIEPVAKFLIHFTEQTRGERRDTLDERHMFDGRWYIELQSRTKTFEKREVRRPEDKTDPYKVGAGLFPLPFGQKKDDILREFEVTLVSPAADDPQGADHLHLVPRPGTNTGQNYRELDFWVDREGLTAGLPIKVRVAKLDGTGKVNSHITITFDDARLDDPKFDDGVFDLKAPQGYQVIEERLEDIPPP